MRMLLQMVGIVAAFGAAVLYWIAARRKIPDMLETKISGEGSLTDILRRQSGMNAWASALAVISALAQLAALSIV